MKKFFRLFLALFCALCLCACLPFSACDPGMSESSSSQSGTGESSSDGQSSDSSGTGDDTGDDTPSDPTLQAKDFLHAEGQVLKNENGEEVVLQGTNLGGWLHFEGWMDGGGGIEANVWGNHHAVLEALSARFTDEEIEELLEIYQTAYITQEDFAFIASLGLNFVRIPFFWTEILDAEGNIRTTAFDQLDWAIETCKELGMYVLLDLHGAPGGHTGGWVTGGHTDSNEFWTNETYQAWTVKIWQTIAARYQDEAAVCGYGLLNEPVPPEGAEHENDERKMYDMLYRAVREIDTRHIVVMGAFYNFDQLGSPHINGWENVVYETHHYDDANKSAENQNNFMAGQLSYIQNYKVKWNVPVLAGEFNFWSAENAWRSWLYTLTATGVSWCNWTYKNTEQNPANCWGIFHTPDVESIDYAHDDFETIARKWRGYSTENYVQNEFLCNIMQDAAVFGWDHPDGEIYDTSGYRATAYRTESGETPLSALFDGDLTSHWSNGEAQAESGQWVEIDLGEETALNRVDIFCPHADFARGYRLSALVDGTWRVLQEGTGFAGNICIRFEEVRTEKLKIEQTAANAMWWRIYEIFTYLEKTDEAAD